MFTLESLGLSQGELQERVVAHIADLILSSTSYDEDGDRVETASRFKQQIVTLVKKRSDEVIAKMAEDHLLPKVNEFIETLTLQQTNQWGEKTKKPPLTFIEYLIERAQVYITEPVSRDGRTEQECRARNDHFGGGTPCLTPRLTQLVNDHLSHSIKTAMEEAVKTAHGGLAKALEETARIKLAEIAQNLKVQSTIK